MRLEEQWCSVERNNYARQSHHRLYKSNPIRYLALFIPVVIVGVVVVLFMIW